jgi:hypothetical protein
MLLHAPLLPPLFLLRCCHRQSQERRHRGTVGAAPGLQWKRWQAAGYQLRCRLVAARVCARCRPSTTDWVTGAERLGRHQQQQHPGAAGADLLCVFVLVCRPYSSFVVCVSLLQGSTPPIRTPRPSVDI